MKIDMLSHVIVADSNKLEMIQMSVNKKLNKLGFIPLWRII